jgi:hypothetical protein
VIGSKLDCIDEEGGFETLVDACVKAEQHLRIAPPTQQDVDRLRMLVGGQGAGTGAPAYANTIMTNTIGGLASRTSGINTGEKKRVVQFASHTSPLPPVQQMVMPMNGIPVHFAYGGPVYGGQPMMPAHSIGGGLAFGATGGRQNEMQYRGDDGESNSGKRKATQPQAMGMQDDSKLLRAIANMLVDDRARDHAQEKPKKYPRYGGPHDRDGHALCSTCGSDEHLDKYCPRNPKRCGKCGRLGHPAHSCWAGRRCEHCNKKNHRSDECFTQMTDEQRRTYIRRRWGNNNSNADALSRTDRRVSFGEAKSGSDNQDGFRGRYGGTTTFDPPEDK